VNKEQQSLFCVCINCIANESICYKAHFDGYRKFKLFIKYLKKICSASFREICKWLKFPLNGLRGQSRVSPVVGLLPLASGPACLGMAFLTLFSNWQKDSWQTSEETSRYVRPERVNNWPNSMTDI